MGKGPHQDPGSFRDPAGVVFDHDGRILRLCSAEGAARIAAVEATELLQTLVAEGRLLPYAQVADGAGLDVPDGGLVLEHPRLDFVTYPYEWSATFLRRVALFHLRLQLDAFDRGVTLIDATPFNVQSRNGQPVFIDHLSFAPYVPGELWWGYDQFLRGFLNPLVLAASGRSLWRALYRARFAEIDPETTRTLLPWYRRLRPGVFRHVSVPALLQRTGEGDPVAVDIATRADAPTLSIPPQRYRAQLAGLLAFVETLDVSGGTSHWQDYTDARSYDADEVATKRAFVARYCAAETPALLVDLGCNTGEFARVALDHGAASVVGVDSDPASIEAAAQDIGDRRIAFVPLVIDLRDPVAGMGWRNRERASFLARCQDRSVLALALTHHLAITGRIPLPEVARWLTATFRDGVVEFVPLDDPMAVRLMRNVRAQPVDYTRTAFEDALAEGAAIVDRVQTSASGRMLYRFRAMR